MASDHRGAPQSPDNPDGPRSDVGGRAGAPAPTPASAHTGRHNTGKESTFDAVVIGAGVIGAAIAFELGRRGRRVLCVDKLPAAGFGSTVNSCAIVRFTYSTYTGVAMAYEGLQYWLDWPAYLEAADELGLIEYKQCGMAVLKDPGGHYLKVLPHFDAIGVAYEEWSTDELVHRMPILDAGVFGPPKRPDDPDFWADPTEQLPGAVFTPEAGYVSDPQLTTHNLQRAAEAAGAEFRFATAVTAIGHAGGRVTGVTLDGDTAVAAPVVVNVAGPHSYLINRMAGVYESMNIKTRALRHEVHHAPGPAGFDYERDGFNIADDDNGIYFRPETGNHILVGSTDPRCDPQDWVDPDEYDQRLGAEQWEAQVLRLNRRLPSLGVPHERKGVVDLYDVSDDWIPIYDRTDLDGFYVAIGTSGNQFKNAGVAGHCMAELIEAVDAGHDHDADPLVVEGRYTGLPIDMGNFSRNREVNPNSSMSVHG